MLYCRLFLGQKRLQPDVLFWWMLPWLKFLYRLFGIWYFFQLWSLFVGLRGGCWIQGTMLVLDCKSYRSITGRVCGIFLFLRIGMVMACFHMVRMSSEIQILLGVLWGGWSEFHLIQEPSCEIWILSFGVQLGWRVGYNSVLSGEFYFVLFLCDSDWVKLIWVIFL